MAKKIRMGVIGAGGMGRHRIATMLNGPDKDKLQIVAVAEPNGDMIARLEAVSGKIPKKRKYTAQTGFEQMIKDGDLDAVSIFSPHSLHYEQLMCSLEAGLDVLIEKPFVTGVGNAIRACKLADKKKAVLLICYQRHFEPQYWMGREIIAGKRFELGEVKGFYVYVAQTWGGFGGWRLDAKFSRGQPDDTGSHYQDILIWMTGLLPKSVEGCIDYRFHGEKKDVPVNFFGHLTLENGAEGKLIILGDYYGGFSDDVEIDLEGGLIVFGGIGANRKLTITKKDGTVLVNEIPSLPKAYPTSPEDNFIGLLTERYKDNYVPGMLGARVSLLADAIIAAEKPGKKVSCQQLVEEAGYKMDDLR